MDGVLPLNLVGDNLGKRHQCLNSCVNDAFQQNISLQTILDQPEGYPIDRVFKIELASKHKNVLYIINQLKERDMLFVSKALKSHWLLEPVYSYIINPIYLETNIYPLMTTVAVNKVKKWIELNLKDPKRCQEFYEYYKTNFDVAIKFLWHCASEFITEQISKILHNLTPKHLRLLSEKCPEVAKVYFDSLANNKEALRRYLDNQKLYNNSFKGVLKKDGDLYLDIAEKHFSEPLSHSATKYIMKNYKRRYLNKPEFYAATLLDIKTFAPFLGSEEIKDIVLRLARAKYLSYNWFTYQRVEPLIKCLNSEERTELINIVFVDKSVGTEIETWPYPVPPSLRYDYVDLEPFDDITHKPSEYVHYENTGPVKKKKNRFVKCKTVYRADYEAPKTKLDLMFDQYCFMNFNQTFFELRKELLIESSFELRRLMILVLVSKAGANEAEVGTLLHFLAERHSNEEEYLRDSIARSLVKRAFAWRLPTASWELMLKWAQTSVREILHATILRHLLSNTPCPPSTLESYLLDFSDLTEYSLNAAERACIAERLPVLLVSTDNEALLLSALRAYNCRIETVPGAEAMLITAARKDEDFLQRLFSFRIARRQLFKESFGLFLQWKFHFNFLTFQIENAYLNALKHDISVLEDGASFVNLISDKFRKKHSNDRFLQKLILYFYEPDGLGARHLSALVSAMEEKYDRSFARPFAFLCQLGPDSLLDYIRETDEQPSAEKSFAAALVANAHVSRPLTDVVKADWHALGAKIVANTVLVSSDKDVDKYIQLCLKSKKTMRLALRLSLRNNSVREVFAAVVRVRPIAALKVGLSYLCKGTIDTDLWHIIKPIIENLDVSLPYRTRLHKKLFDLDSIPSQIEADYWTAIFKASRKNSEVKSMPILCKIENFMPKVDIDFLNIIIMEFISNRLNKDDMLKEDFCNKNRCLYFRIIAKYLLCNKNDQIVQYKNITVCNLFFDKIEILWKEMDETCELKECIEDFLLALKFSKLFLDTNYVSCEPMFERILQRLHNIWPIEQYFTKYVCIHLTMLYCRSIRQAKKQNPDIFEDRKLMRDEGPRLVGFILGKYIGRDIQELIQRYFRSIIEIYQQGLSRFLRDYFKFNDDRSKLLTAVIRGLLEGQAEAFLLAEHVFVKESYYLKDKDKKEIAKILKDAKSEEFKFFHCARLYVY